MYEWLAEKKRESMMKKLQKKGMAAGPVSETNGVSFTGYGNDGILQKGNAAGSGLGHTYHEGETRINTPEGSAYITADLTKRAGLQPEGLRSYATGGMDLRNPRARGVPDSNTATAVLENYTVPTPVAQTIASPIVNNSAQNIVAQSIPTQTIQTTAPTRTTADYTPTLARPIETQQTTVPGVAAPTPVAPALLTRQQRSILLPRLRIQFRQEPRQYRQAQFIRLLLFLRYHR
jgi:hypothetical protein